MSLVYDLSLLEETHRKVLKQVEWCVKKRWNRAFERSNQEVRRRTDTVGIFPDRNAILSSSGMVLIEKMENGLVGNCILARNLCRNF